MAHHQVLNRDQRDKDYEANNIVAAYDKLAEGLYHLAGCGGAFIAMQQNSSSARQIEGQTHQRQQQD